MAGFRIEGNTSGNVAEVDANHALSVNLPTDKARQQRERELKAIIAKSFETVTGEPVSPVSVPVTPQQRQTVAKRTFKASTDQGYVITLREIERLIRAYERELAQMRETAANDFMRQEDEFMMVMLLA